MRYDAVAISRALTTHTSNTPSFLLEERSSMSVYVWKTHELARERAGHPEKKRTVLILYTGGTIGMMWSEKEGMHSPRKLAYGSLLSRACITLGLGTSHIYIDWTEE